MNKQIYIFLFITSDSPYSCIFLAFTVNIQFCWCGKNINDKSLSLFFSSLSTYQILLITIFWFNYL